MSDEKGIDFTLTFPVPEPKILALNYCVFPGSLRNY